MAVNDIIVPKENASGTFDEITLPDATTSARGLLTSADKTKLDGIAAGAEVNVNADWNATSGDAQILNKPTSLTPTAHSASHAAAGSDPLAPSDIGAQSIFSVTSLVITTTSQVTLTAARAKIYDIVQYAGAQVDVKLPSTNAIEGDIVVMRWGTGGDSIRVIQSASGSPITTVSSGEQKRFIRGATDIWSLVPVDTHAHPATAISDSTTAGRALLTGADNSAQRTSLGLGTAATSATGDFAAASHSHGNINSSGQVGSDSGRVLVTTTAGAVTTLALGTANQVLRTKSDLSGVEFADPAAAGVTGASSSASDVLGVSGANITGVDAGSDKIVFWDDSASELTYLTVGSGLSLTDTTLTATATGGGTKTYAVFTAEHNQPPSTAFATLDTRNSIAVLDFDAATDENAVFVGIMPEAASLGSGLIVRLHWMATTATSGNVRWGVQFERSNTDLDADSFDTAVEATAAANGTSGILTTTAITVTTIDGITAGDVFRLKVFRNADDATNDTMTGDAELVAVEIRSAA
jgi:hypothetical protein